MDFTDFAENFNCFTICKIPTKYDPQSSGFIFQNQKIKQGKYTSDPKSAWNKFDFVVKKERITL